MIDILGLEVMQAEKILNNQGINYKISEYCARKPLENTDIKRVVRVKEQANCLLLTICCFRGNAI